MTENHNSKIILFSICAVIATILPVSVYYLGFDIIHKRHIQFTTDQDYIQKVSCNDLQGNLTNLKSVQLYDVKQLEDDIIQLQKEKSC